MLSLHTIFPCSLVLLGNVVDALGALGILYSEAPERRFVGITAFELKRVIETRVGHNGPSRYTHVLNLHTCASYTRLQFWHRR